MKKYIRPEMVIMEGISGANGFFCTSIVYGSDISDKFADNELEMLSNRDLWSSELFDGMGW